LLRHVAISRSEPERNPGGDKSKVSARPGVFQEAARYEMGKEQFEAQVGIGLPRGFQRKLVTDAAGLAPPSSRKGT
jgi:hypothetical protein